MTNTQVLNALNDFIVEYRQAGFTDDEIRVDILNEASSFTGLGQNPNFEGLVKMVLGATPARLARMIKIMATAPRAS